MVRDKALQVTAASSSLSRNHSEHPLLLGRKIDGIALAIVAIFVFLATYFGLQTAYSNQLSKLDQTPIINTDPDTAVLNLQLGYQIKDDLDDEHEKHDEWARHRRYAVVIDAGSSGSRVLVYSWKDPLHVRKQALKDPESGPAVLSGLPVIEKGSETGEWQFKEDPGKFCMHLAHMQSWSVPKEPYEIKSLWFAPLERRVRSTQSHLTRIIVQASHHTLMIHTT